jgi:putative ATP-dependent endonuclease of OLD family
VRTFVAGEWTLEYDLAHSGLTQEVWKAAVLALADENIQVGKVTKEDAIGAREAEFLALAALELEAKASHVYALFETEGASKAIGAQYLAELLEHAVESGGTGVDELRSKLPSYVLDAIAHVTAPIPVTTAPEEQR